MRLQTEARMLSVGQRVRRGAAWLDTKRPGWHHEIAVGRLDIDSSHDCVLAQLNGNSFYTALNRMDPAGEINLGVHGFTSSGSREETAALNHEWRTLILRRQYGEHPPPRWFTRLARWITRRP